mgnify:CR=1 FL=1
MTQATHWGVPSGPPATPVEYAARDNAAFDALLSGHAGASRPAYAVAGTEWVSTAIAGKLRVYRFDGNADRLLFTVDTASGAIAWSNGTSDDVLGDLAASVAALAVAVAGKASRRNRHLNPGFQICQDRATGATVTLASGGYVFDGVGAVVNGGGALTCGQVAEPTPGGSPYRARFAVSTADAAIAASDFYCVSLLIEGVDIADLMFGTAAARSFVWRGVVNAPAGTWGLSFHNAAATRCRVVPIVIPAERAGTDVPVSVVVPGDVAGAWPSDGANIGIRVNLCIAAGSTFQTATPDTWQAGDFLATPAQTNGMASLANVFELADIGLYAGTELPAWEVSCFDEDLHRCRRFWESSYPYGVAPGTAAGGESAWGSITSGDPTLIAVGAGGAFHVEKRAAPALSIFYPPTGAASTVQINGNPVGVSAVVGSPKALTRVYLASPNLGAWSSLHWVANARFAI